MWTALHRRLDSLTVTARLHNTASLLLLTHELSFHSFSKNKHYFLTRAFGGTFSIFIDAHEKAALKSGDLKPKLWLN